MSIFFVHIPKTAGTSFRLGAENYFGKARVWYDYGEKERETSESVVNNFYKEGNDGWALRREMEESDIALLGGHVRAAKFSPLVGIGNTLTFVREPLQRMVSEYQHFVRHHNYQDDFKTFYSRPVMHNRLHHFLVGVEPEALGFIGLTERYAESLEMLNDHYSIAIPGLEANRGKKDIAFQHEISNEDAKALRRLNRRDVMLYDKCQALFETRLDLYNKGQPYAHACLREANQQRISGWAWWARPSEIPVEIEIWVNGNKVKTVKATELRPNLCHLRPPRGGYVGFHVRGEFSPGDRVQCCVASTGQWFPLEPRRVPKPEAL